jgi:triosephosphate isomerase
MRKPIIVGNWKMNKTIAEAASFVESIEVLLHDDAEFGVGAPFLALEKAVAASKRLLVAAQNVHFEDSGAFTR